MWVVLPALLASAAAQTARTELSTHVGQSFKLDTSVIGNQSNRINEGAVTTAVSRNYALVAEISIGTPAQKMRCLLDTGSSDMWVPSKRCASCGTERTFDADVSSTFTPELVKTYHGRQPRQVGIGYGSGEIVGYSVSDTFSLGQTKIMNQSFIIVEDAELPPRQAWDGICGLGWEGLAKVDGPLYKRLQEQGTPAIFSFVPGQEGQKPYLTVGAMAEEETMKAGTLAWAKAEKFAGPQLREGQGDRSFWIVSGGIAVTKKEPVPARFLVDTGTNQVLLAPAKYYDAFMRSLLPPTTFDRLCGRDPMAGNLVICECSIAKQSDLPPLRIYLGDRAFVLPIADLFTDAHVRDGARDGGDLCILQIQPNGVSGGGLPDILGGLLGGLLGGPPVHGSHRSSGGPPPIVGSGGDALAGLLGALLGRRLQMFRDPTEDLWMIGGVFLERFVTVFDFDGGRIGFAEPAGGLTPLRPSKLNEELALDAGVNEGNHGRVIAISCLAAGAALFFAVLSLAWRVRTRGVLRQSEFQEVDSEPSSLGEA